MSLFFLTCLSCSCFFSLLQDFCRLGLGMGWEDQHVGNGYMEQFGYLYFFFIFSFLAI